ncbi:MAG: hypothetical protein WDO70_11740 [Alphaproteobacteria bacterium]
MQNMNSTEYLEFIAKNNLYLFYEKDVPGGITGKRDAITMGDKDGRRAGLSNPLGYSNSCLELPMEVFEDFLTASFVKKTDEEDKNGSAMFCLTEEGKARGMS